MKKPTIMMSLGNGWAVRMGKRYVKPGTPGAKQGTRGGWFVEAGVGRRGKAGAAKPTAESFRRVNTLSPLAERKMAEQESRLKASPGAPLEDDMSQVSENVAARTISDPGFFKTGKSVDHWENTHSALSKGDYGSAVDHINGLLNHGQHDRTGDKLADMSEYEKMSGKTLHPSVKAHLQGKIDQHNANVDAKWSKSPNDDDALELDAGDEEDAWDDGFMKLRDEIDREQPKKPAKTKPSLSRADRAATEIAKIGYRKVGEKAGENLVSQGREGVKRTAEMTPAWRRRLKRRPELTGKAKRTLKLALQQTSNLSFLSPQPKRFV